MANAVTKSVFSLDTRGDAASNIRRVLRAALTLPYAPVALICPPDLLEQEADATAEPVHAPTLGALSAEDAQQYARLLTTGEAGDRLSRPTLSIGGCGRSRNAVSHKGRTN
jgi:thiamine pyrophosphate-dependent acetolactate synthase large subunit-like protein